MNPQYEPLDDSQIDGLVTYRLNSWSDYFDFIEQQVLKQQSGANHTYVWRGQRSAHWTLSTSLDRLYERLGFLSLGDDELERRTASHLESFKYAARGRRGYNPPSLEPNNWWALGQHYGLATPLLDWCKSPFAAAYFAFEELSDGESAYRVVYGLDQRAVELKTAELAEGESFERGRPPIIEFFDPISDENPRLVSQGGLFTRSPIGTPIEQWIAKAFEGSTQAVLVRVEIPDRDRDVCLRTLNHMNINHLSLFPDLNGASRFTNLKLELGA